RIRRGPRTGAGGEPSGKRAAQVIPFVGGTTISPAGDRFQLRGTFPVQTFICVASDSFSHRSSTFPVTALSQSILNQYKLVRRITRGLGGQESLRDTDNTEAPGERQRDR